MSAPEPPRGPVSRRYRRRQSRAFREDGTPWARGPARTTSEQDRVPRGWGSNLQAHSPALRHLRSSYGDPEVRALKLDSFELRRQAWLVRPAKERRAHTGARLLGDPTMPVVSKFLGPVPGLRNGVQLEVRWSAGLGFWPGEERERHRAPRAAGYWLGVVSPVSGCSEPRWAPDLEALQGLLAPEFTRIREDARKVEARLNLFVAELDSGGPFGAPPVAPVRPTPRNPGAR